VLAVPILATWLLATLATTYLPGYCGTTSSDFRVHSHTVACGEARDVVDEYVNGSGICDPNYRDRDVCLVGGFVCAQLTSHDTPDRCLAIRGISFSEGAPTVASNTFDLTRRIEIRNKTSDSPIDMLRSALPWALALGLLAFVLAAATSTSRPAWIARRAAKATAIGCAALATLIFSVLIVLSADQDPGTGARRDPS
jgi:hypothetical protein